MFEVGDQVQWEHYDRAADKQSSSIIGQIIRIEDGRALIARRREDGGAKQRWMDINRLTPKGGTLPTRGVGGRTKNKVKDNPCERCNDRPARHRFQGQPVCSECLTKDVDNSATVSALTRRSCCLGDF